MGSATLSFTFVLRCTGDSLFNQASPRSIFRCWEDTLAASDPEILDPNQANNSTQGCLEVWGLQPEEFANTSEPVGGSVALSVLGSGRRFRRFQLPRVLVVPWLYSRLVSGTGWRRGLRSQSDSLTARQAPDTLLSRYSARSESDAKNGRFLS